MSYEVPPSRDTTFWLVMWWVVGLVALILVAVAWFTADCSTLVKASWSAGDLPTRCVETKP